LGVFFFPPKEQKRGKPPPPPSGNPGPINKSGKPPRSPKKTTPFAPLFPPPHPEKWENPAPGAPVPPIPGFSAPYKKPQAPKKKQNSKNEGKGKKNKTGAPPPGGPPPAKGGANAGFFFPKGETRASRGPPRQSGAPLGKNGVFGVFEVSPPNLAAVGFWEGGGARGFPKAKPLGGKG